MSWGHGWWGFSAWGGCVSNGPDALVPTIGSQDPAPNSVGIPNTAQIKFRLSDGAAPDAEHTGIDFSSIQISVAQGSYIATIFAYGSFNFGYSGVISANDEGGFDFVITPAAPWIIGSTVSVLVTCSDGNCNATSFSWQFSVGICLQEPCSAVSSLTSPSIGAWGDGLWGALPWGGSGPSTILPISGGGAPSISTVTPNVGTILGNTDFVITGTELACFSFNDIFSDAVVNPALWWAQGAGSTVEDPYGLGGKLKCHIPATAGTLAGVLATALTLRSDFHLEVEYAIQTPFMTFKPSSEVTLASLRVEFDAGNYLQMSFVMKGPTATAGTIRCEVWKLGILQHIKEIDTTAAAGKFGVMRYADPTVNDWKAAFWWNGTKILDTFDCPACTMLFSFGIKNNIASYEVETWFDNFKSRSVVAFIGPSGTDVASNIVEVSELKLRGKTPPTLGNWAGPVTVRVTNGSGNGCRDLCSDCFTYQLPDAFVIGRTEPYRPTRKEISIVDDSILRNPNQNIGLGLRRQV